MGTIVLFLASFDFKLTYWKTAALARINQASTYEKNSNKGGTYFTDEELNIPEPKLIDGEDNILDVFDVNEIETDPDSEFTFIGDEGDMGRFGNTDDFKI